MRYLLSPNEWICAACCACAANCDASIGTMQADQMLIRRGDAAGELGLHRHAAAPARIRRQMVAGYAAAEATGRSRENCKRPNGMALPLGTSSVNFLGSGHGRFAR